MSDPYSVLDLSAPTGWWEVAVWHHAGGRFLVSTDRGTGRCDQWETDKYLKACGVAEWLDQEGRITYAGGHTIHNEGEPFTGGVVHWDCGCTQADIDALKATF